MVSRTKVENFVNLVLNATNVCLYLLVVVAAVFKCLHADFATIVICIYGCIMAIALVVNELKSLAITLNYFRFLCTYRGRSVLFIFFGCLTLDANVLNIIVGTLCLALGIVYMILSFIPVFPPPNPVVINWQNWKDFSAEGLDLARPKHVTVESHIAMRLQSPPPQHTMSPYPVALSPMSPHPMSPSHPVSYQSPTRVSPDRS